MREHTVHFTMPEHPAFDDLREFVAAALERYMAGCEGNTNPSTHGFAIELLQRHSMLYDAKAYDG